MSTRNSARSARALVLANSRSSSVILRSLSSGFALALGPRFFGSSPALPSRSRTARQLARCDDYRPSRRSMAPSSPGFLQLSASAKILRLYSAVKRRR